MAPRGLISVTTVILFPILGLLISTPAICSQTNKVCCTRYNRKPVPFQRIVGYREQTTKESCHMEAIIFYTLRKNEVCATRRDEWVRKTLELLSTKLKKMAKARGTATETPMETSENHSFDGPHTKASFLNHTEGFY